MSDEFTFFGLTVPKLARADGGFLVLWGIAAYFLQSSDPPSLTAMIPAFLGAPLLILGILADRNTANLHHYMHAAMGVAFLMVLGGARIITGWNGMSNLTLASHIVLIATGVCFMTAGIRSFRHARKLREAGGD
ncbi:MAG TPA: hypothetical protein EYQ15_02460 [Candidatus Poseidoniales archaeon]|jgi:hypothetical protein|nr:MAG: hypothetical protein CXT65_03430 [Euryarchaeota archaeon]HIG38161.1 hypothetical protein [Candidatus Poseidoniales archaeon]HIL44023.1 hypothetical protein [Candidatus Poseidoniales archaeon]|tara:strand:- start:66 stop:467 length:402 start_codon:yes stop_codon:yes gene_type:complete